jgi:hypothetical protein
MVKSNTIVYILFVVLFATICSCGNNTSSKTTGKVKVVTYNDTTQVIPSPKSKAKLPNGYAYGKVISPTFPDSMKAERNLLLQVASYNSALLHGDVNTCKKFLYPDAFKYCRKYYPEFSDEEVMDEFFKDASGEFQTALAKMKEQGIDMDIAITNFERKVIIGDDIIIVFNIVSNQFSDNVFIHSTIEDKTIGISQNGGTNWWFMSNHNDLPTILAIRYDQEVINAVMNY